MPPKILLAEDESFIAKMYAAEMERHGAQVTIASNGTQILDLLKRELFDLLLLDLLMPLMDGFDVLTALKNSSLLLPKIVVLTNISQSISRQKCKELGAVDYIVKSDSISTDLWEKIQKYLPKENVR